jgi:hypothetical protein
MFELVGVLVVVDDAAWTSMVEVAHTCVGPELPLTYWRLPDGESHWTPNSQSLPLSGVVASQTSTGWDPVGVPGARVKLAFSCGGLSTLEKNVRVSGAGVAVAALESVKVHVPSPLFVTPVTSVPTGMSVPLIPSPTRSL